MRLHGDVGGQPEGGAPGWYLVLAQLQKPELATKVTFSLEG